MLLGIVAKNGVSTTARSSAVQNNVFKKRTLVTTTTRAVSSVLLQSAQQPSTIDHRTIPKSYCNSNFGLNSNQFTCQQQLNKRNFGTKSPGLDPLELIRKECLARNLCDEHGYRRPGVHWVFSIAITPDDPNHPPNLRTVGVQRVSPSGIDFVMKKGSGTCDALRDGRPMSILHLQGRYVPGETAEQWRGEGFCEVMPLPEILEQLPHYTITAMLSSKRVEKEKASNGSDDGRTIMDNKSHMTEVQQKTRMELENGDVSEEEIEEAIRAFRFHPTRIECMAGGPDNVLWNRWEWSRDDDGLWNPPTALLPH